MGRPLRRDRQRREARSYDYTPIQRVANLLPEGTSRFLGGGRGGSKSEQIIQAAAIRAKRYGADAKILVLRKGPFRAMNDLLGGFRRVFNAWFGIGNHHLNKSDHVWHVPGGAHIEFGILPDGQVGRTYYEDMYQGRSFTDILADEAQQWALPQNLDLLVSNLRGNIPTRMIIAANPGGIGHQWLAQRFITGREPWREYVLEKEILDRGRVVKTSRKWVTAPSTYRDNPHNGPDYVSNLAISCGNDTELLKAWLSGSWKISRGAYFAGVLDNVRVEINWPDPEGWGGWVPHDWEFWLAYDHGSAAPAVTYVMARSPGSLGPDGVYYPADSILVLDEWACYRPNDLSSGFGWTIPNLAGPIKSLASRWRIPAVGVADSACFSEHGHEDGSIADEFGENGVIWYPAPKGRRAARFLRYKRMLSHAGNYEEPGLYVSKRCVYWWLTVPFIVHDPKNREVPLSCDTDHGLDSSSYGLDGMPLSGGVIAGVR